MLSRIFRCYRSDIAPVSNDLNKKILEAFASIIEKGVKISSSSKEPAMESIARYNVESRNSVVAIQDYKNKMVSPAETEPLIHRNLPDIFKRNKISPVLLHKNVFLMSKMLTPSGSLLSKSITKLSSKSHRNLSKAIRRARQMGILPYMYCPKVNLARN